MYNFFLKHTSQNKIRKVSCVRISTILFLCNFAFLKQNTKPIFQSIDMILRYLVFVDVIILTNLPWFSLTVITKNSIRPNDCG